MYKLTTVFGAVAVVAALAEVQRPAEAAAAPPSDVAAKWLGGTRPRVPGLKPPAAPPTPPPVSPPPPPPSNESVVPPLFGAPGSGSECADPTPCPACPACPKPETPPVFSYLPGPPPAGGSGTECVAPLAGMMTCATFLEGSQEQPPQPQSDCCHGLRGFMRSTRAWGGERTLRCLCPVILGQVNRVLPRPIDPVRVLYLPVACGVLLPPQTLYICFAGHAALSQETHP